MSAQRVAESSRTPAGSRTIGRHEARAGGCLRSGGAEARGGSGSLRARAIPGRTYSRPLNFKGPDGHRRRRQRRLAVKRKGDIAIAFHWVNKEPAMVLFPARPNTLGATACVIPLASAQVRAPTAIRRPIASPRRRSTRADGHVHGPLHDPPHRRRHPREHRGPARHAAGAARSCEREAPGRVIGEMTLKSGGKTIGGRARSPRTRRAGDEHRLPSSTLH
jgi:hypothetical protein